MSLNLTDLGRDLTAGRKKNEELSPAARAAICGAVAGGVSKRAVAAAFGVSHIVVSKTIQRFTTTRSFDSKPRSGRPQVLTRKDKRYIVQLAKRNARLTHQQLLKILGRKVSSSTVRRALRQRNYRKWRALKRIPLTNDVAKDRYTFACHALESIEDLLRVSWLILFLSTPVSNLRLSRLCLATNPLARTIQVVQLLGSFGCLQRSGSQALLTSKIMSRPTYLSLYGVVSGRGGGLTSSSWSVTIHLPRREAIVLGAIKRP